PVTAVADSGTTVDEETVLSVAATGVLANDLHGSDDPLHVSAVAGGTVGTAFQLDSGATLKLNSDGSYTYDPSTITGIENKPAGTFADSFSYTASDGHGDTSSATVNITVTIPAEAVTAVADTGTTVDEETVLT